MSPTPINDAHDPQGASSAPIEADVDQPVSGAPSDNTTLVDILRALQGEGYRASFSATGDGRLACSACGDSTSPEAFDAQVQRRLEGASDPDDEMLVLAGACGKCGTLGTVVLGFGPTSGPADGAVLERLSL
jgi:hypothetical protein